MALPSPFTCTNTKAGFTRERLLHWLDQVVHPHAAEPARLSFCLRATPPADAHRTNSSPDPDIRGAPPAAAHRWSVRA